MIVINKSDLFADHIIEQRFENISDLSTHQIVKISAKQGKNLDGLKSKLIELSNLEGVSDYDVVLTNSRHYEAISQALDSMEKVLEGLDNEAYTDLLAMDIRQALHYLGEITGEITTDEVLGNIFKNFCIGK